MKRIFLFLFVLLLFAIFVTVPKASAQEVDYLADAIEALKTSNVYVAPGTPGTDFDTLNNLNQVLRVQDNVVLVMLPPEALVGTDMFAIAKEISNGIGNSKTIGLAVGEEVFGYSLLLPEGVAFDLMERADDVTSDPAGTLITFSQNVHLWLGRNEIPTPTPSPEPTPTPRPTMQPIELPKAKDVGWPIWTCLGVFLLLLFVFLTRGINNSIKESKIENKRQERQSGLEELRQKIQVIEIDVSNISSIKIKKDLKGAILLAYGLIDILEESDTYIGMTESLTPAMIANMGMQVKALLRHESGRRPMSDELLTDLTSALLNYDALFLALQKDDPDTAELLASIIHTKTTVISKKGYLED